MKCSRIQEWISLEMDEQLPPEHVGELQDHLETCAECYAFRDDLQIGLRMLSATDPELPDNFDWKLQLRLSQTLREAARDTSYPWQAGDSSWRRWFARASLSAALGLAAVLAVAVMAPTEFASVTGNGGATTLIEGPLRLPVQTTAVTEPLLDASRRPLNTRTTYNPFGSSSGLQRRVSNGGLGDGYLGGARDFDLLRLHQVEQELESMRRRMHAKDRTIEVLQARLDSLTGPNVDTR